MRPYATRLRAELTPRLQFTRLERSPLLDPNNWPTNKSIRAAHSNRTQQQQQQTPDCELNSLLALNGSTCGPMNLLDCRLHTAD